MTMEECAGVYIYIYQSLLCDLRQPTGYHIVAKVTESMIIHFKMYVDLMLIASK